MEETFEALEISPKTFVKFLNKKLDVKDPRYQDCKELWESNLPLTSQQRLLLISNQK